MAVHATHRTANVQTAPSLFEIIAQDALNNAIYPAVRKIIETIAAVNPKRWEKLPEWSDEIYLGLNGVLQYYYIRCEGGSFSESFYGLERVPVYGYSLTTPQKVFSFSCLVLVPYLRAKFEATAVQYRMDDCDGLLSHNESKDNLKRFLYQIEPLVALTWRCFKFVQYLRFLSGKSVYSSPELLLLSIKLQHSQRERETIPWTELWRSIQTRQFWSSDATLKTVGQVVFRSMEVGAFFLQFLQWWYAETAHTNITALPVPPPPDKDIKARQYKGVCPICLQRWKIPTVVPASGYVFCYRCIMRSLKETHKCPVTNIPTNVDELIRMYDD